MKKENSGYIIHTFRVTESVHHLVFELTKKYSKENREFFVHILFGTIHTIKRDTKGWIPIYSELIKEHWGQNKIKWEELKEDKLIEVSDYSKEQSLSREFKVVDEIIDQVVNASPEETKDFMSCQYFNLMTGKKMNTFTRHKLSDDNRNSLPELIQDSMKSIKRCIVNDQAIQEFLTNTYGDYLFGGEEDNKYRYFNDKHCYDSLRQTGIKILDNGFIEYYPGYESQFSGRISEKGGGMQSCSREMKDAAFSGIENLHNYDLKSSQVWGLIQWFEKATLDISWLKKYLGKSKKEYADAVGISIDIWKKCFCALIMGGQTSTKSKDKNKLFELAIVEALYEEANKDEKLMFEMLHKFDNITEGLNKELTKWHEWIIKTYVPDESYYVKGRQYVKNKCGMTFCISDYKSKDGKWININELKRRLAAFFLQGTEAAFIHHLSWVSAKYGYEVLNNQHDGLVTLGEIPQEAVEYAKKESGLKYAILEEKPFI